MSVNDLVKNWFLPQPKAPSLKKGHTAGQNKSLQSKRSCVDSRENTKLHQYFPVKKNKTANAKEEKSTYVPYQNIVLNEMKGNYSSGVSSSEPQMGAFSSAPIATSTPSTSKGQAKKRDESVPILNEGVSLEDYIEAKDIEFFPQDVRNAIAYSQTTSHSLTTSYLNLFHGHPIADLRYAFISKKTYSELLEKRTIEQSGIDRHSVLSDWIGPPQLCCPFRNLVNEILSHLVYDFNQFSLPVSSSDYEEALIQLQEFDSSALGPSSGLTRLERFERSQNAGKYTPQSLKKILLSLQGHRDPKIKFSSYSKL